MTTFTNLDLLSVGIAIASTLILGFVVFFNNPKSATSKAFLFFSIMTILWGSANYMQYQIHDSHIALWVLRLAIFFAVWHTFSFFHFFYVFPEEEKTFPWWYRCLIIPFVVLASLLNLTPAVFDRIGAISQTGEITQIVNGPGIVVFALAVFGFLVTGIILLLKKMLHGEENTKKQLQMIAAGACITFTCIIVFNFIFPAFLDNVRAIKLGALFLLPFVACTFYAIVKHHLLDVKVISTEVLAFLLTVVSLIEVIVSHGVTEIVLRTGVFLLILSFSILLVRSVLREVKQREELQKLSEELKAANDKLVVADRMKSQFLSFASHQVKSPMTVMKGYASLIMDGSFGAVPDKVKETAEKIKESSNRLIALVNNLLDLRKLEEGKVEYLMADFDISALTKSVVDEQKTVATAKGLELTLAAPTNPITVHADQEKIRQVIQNLIDNSIKYTEHGYVKVKMKNENSKIKIEVEDSGIGIPADLLPSLFEQFNRGSQEAKKIQGTGLGLYIAKMFMLAHKGKVWAESDGPGKGSRFIMELPLSTPGHYRHPVSIISLG